MDDEQGRKWSIVIPNVKRDGFTMEWLKFGVTGVVDKHELANLFLVER